MQSRLLCRPANDLTTNDFMRDVIGSKADSAAVGVPSSTESIMAYLKQIAQNMPEIVAGTTDTTPLASMDLWSCSGPVMIHDIWGIVTTTAVANATTNVKLSFDPDDGGSDVDLCANVDADNAAVGTIIRITKDISDAGLLILDVHEGIGIEPGSIILGQAGDIKVTYGAASAGQINWFLQYTKIGTGVITAA